MSGTAKPMCSLCLEPKFAVHGIWMCPHCDTTVNCKGSQCGACRLGNAKTYPGLPDVHPL